MGSDIKELKKEEVVEVKVEKKIKIKYSIEQYLEIFNVNMDKYAKSYLVHMNKGLMKTQDEWEKEIK